MITGDAIAEEAAAWFARARSGQITEPESMALEAWLARDPAHRAAYEDLQLIWSGLDVVRADPAVLGFREAASRGLRGHRRERLARGLIAACALVVLAAGGGAWLSRLPSATSPEEAAVYRTRVGQTASIVLADGSLAVLDTDSILRVWPEGGRQRRLELVRGRAHFKVAKDPSRPFIVRAEGNDVTALGTRFDVYLKDGGLEVSLMEGRVRVQPRKNSSLGQRPSVEMTPGHRLVAGDDGWGLFRADTQADAGWIQGRLVFDEARVGDIAKELNRYTTGKIVIVDPSVAEKRMSAVVQSDDAATFVAAVETMKLARPTPAANGGYQLRAP